MKILKNDLTTENVIEALNKFFKGTIILKTTIPEIIKDIGILKSRDTFIGIEYDNISFKALFTNRGPTVYYNKSTAKPIASVKLKSDDLTVNKALSLRICRDTTFACMSSMSFLKGPVQDMIVTDSDGDTVMEIKSVNVTVMMSYLYMFNLI